MQIWVDADACPSEIKELLFRAANRTKIKVTLVANQSMRTPRSDFIDSLVVEAGANVADRRIVGAGGRGHRHRYSREYGQGPRAATRFLPVQHRQVTPPFR